MFARFVAGIAAFVALVAIITSWIVQSRSERQGRDITTLREQVRDQQDIIDALVRTQGAQGDVNDAVYKSIRTIQRVLIRGPSRSLTLR